MALFNTALKKYSLQHGFDTVDVFKFTAGKEGFSNGLFHIDNHHLGAKALVEINDSFLKPTVTSYLPKDYSGSPTASLYTPWTEAEVLAHLTAGWGEGAITESKAGVSLRARA